MSYQVLARKWRPHDFDSMVGQDAVVAALRHALDENRLHHAYLFTGTRGVGKTTLSRILAKCLNCTGEDGKGSVTSHPCGKCDACRAIDEGRFPTTSKSMRPQTARWKKLRRFSIERSTRPHKGATRST